MVKMFKYIDTLTNILDHANKFGKAGSAKSTPIKYLYGHSSTSQALERWLGHKGLVIANSYFWHAGIEL